MAASRWLAVLPTRLTHSWQYFAAYQGSAFVVEQGACSWMACDMHIRDPHLDGLRHACILLRLAWLACLWCRRYGLSEEEIKPLTRWNMINLVSQSVWCGACSCSKMLTVVVQSIL